MVEFIRHNGSLLAILIKDSIHEPGIRFFTGNESSLQLAVMRHPKGNIIVPHLHNDVERTVKTTQEVLFIKHGKLRVDFFNENKEYLESRLLETGDIILLSSGGHGFEVIEETEMFEVKQGPYLGEQDKIRFTATVPEIKIKP